LLKEKDFTRSKILAFSEQLKIKPSIVVGRLMHEKLIAYNNYQLNGLRDQYKCQ